jgi:hypothetical protein
MNASVLLGLKNWKSVLGAILIAAGGALSEGGDGTMSMIGKILALVGTTLVGGTVASSVTAAKAEAKAKK